MTDSQDRIYEIPHRDNPGEDSGWYATDEGDWMHVYHHAVPGRVFDKLSIPKTRATGQWARPEDFSPEEHVRHWHSRNLPLFAESRHPGNVAYPAITGWMRERGRELHPDPMSHDCPACQSYRDSGWT